jgi:hypothetical protein
MEALGLRLLPPWPVSPVRASALMLLVGCIGGMEPGEVMPGDYPLERVDFYEYAIEPVPATSVSTLGDSTIVEGGDVILEEQGRCLLEVVYRWRYGGIPGGATVRDTLSYVFDRRDRFRKVAAVDYFRLLRDTVLVGYLVRIGEETLVLTEYQQSGTVDFYFRRR